MSCPECGNNLKTEIIGSTATVSCDKCGWSVARSHVDPIHEDETVYSLYLESGNTANKTALLCLSKIMRCNFLQAKKLLDDGKVLLFSGKATEVREMRDQLMRGKVSYLIEPDFPY